MNILNFSNYLFSTLLLFFVLIYSETQDIKWIIYLIMAFLIKIIIGFILRIVLADLNIYSNKSRFEKYNFVKPRFKTGLFSVNVLASSFIFMILLLESDQKIINMISLIITGIILYIETKEYNIKQTILSLILGLGFGYGFYKLNNYSFKTSSLFIVSVFIACIIYFLIIIYQTCIELKDSKVIVPQWFDSSLVPLYKKKIKNSALEMPGLISRCFIIFDQRAKAIPHKITWEQIEREIDSIKFDNFKPDIVVGIKSGGAFIAKYIAQKYNIPFSYINIKKYSDQNFIELGLEYYKLKVKCLGEDDIDCLRQKGRYKIVENINESLIKNKKVLLVDDSVGTGTTLFRGKEHLYLNGALQVKTYVINTIATNAVDYYSFTDNFIGFPWGLDT